MGKGLRIGIPKGPRRAALGYLLLTLASGGSLSACGFALRKEASFPFTTLHSGFATGSEMGLQFRRIMREAPTVKLVNDAQDAEARLEILRETREKEIVGLSTTGRPREYQLRLRLAFRVMSALPKSPNDPASKELLPETEIILRRDISTNDQQLAAKQQEEVLLYQEMQTDMIQQLMRRLSAIKA